MSRAPTRLALTNWLVRLCAALVVALVSLPAAAQDPYGPGVQPGFGGGGPPSPAPPKGGAGGAKPPPGSPEMHAASGGESLLPPSTEPSLPRKPLKVSKKVRKRIGTSTDPDDAETGRGLKLQRRFYGVFYQEKSEEYSFKSTLPLPLWIERTKLSLSDPTKRDRASLYAGIYYQRRSPDRSDDVVFPFFWNLRDQKTRTTVVGPFVNRVTRDGETDNWLAPLYFTGTRPRGGYTIIPPLLTYLTRDAHGGFNLIGPAFCSWTGGPACDTRTSADIDFGIAPLYFYGQNSKTKYEVIPPLLHYYRYEDKDQSWTNIWGPYYRRHTTEREMLHLMPFYWSIWGKNERHTTVLPFFHYGYKGKSTLFVNPFFLRKTGDEGENLFVTWGYARYRGRTEVDMITPLFWHYRDPDIGLDQKLLFPFLYSRTSPRESSFAFFPFWAHFKRYGISETTWITPFFQHTTHLRGWSTNIHPIFYFGRNGRRTHTVVAPLFWDFASPSSRQTVGFPLFWRFSDREEVSQLVGNVYYRERKLRNGKDWEIHVFPFFSYGETPDGHWWNILYGLAGYTRQGESVKARTLWIPITVSKGASR